MLSTEIKNAVLKFYDIADDMTLEQFCETLGLVRNVAYRDRYADDKVADFIMCFGDEDNLYPAVISVQDLIISDDTSPEYRATFNKYTEHGAFCIKYEEIE